MDSREDSACLISGSDSQVNVMDFTKCIICQLETAEKLICPAKSKRASHGSGYETFAENIMKFTEAGEVPVTIDLKLLNDGQGIAETLKSKEALWHKSCFNKFSNLKLERVLKRKSSESADSPVKTRSKVTFSSDSDTCFFCENGGGKMHRARTMEVHEHVEWCATEINDTKLLAKLSGTDLHALDAMYHNVCLVRLYNKVRAQKRKSTSSENNQNWAESIALAELATYIEEETSETAQSFKLSDLVKLYESRISQLGVFVQQKINSSRLKERLLSNVPGLQAYRSGREVLLAFETDIGEALRILREKHYDSDSFILAKAAKILRREMLGYQQQFSGSFDKDCHEQSIPESLKAMLSMILGGPNILHQTEISSESLVATILCELILFNTVKRRRSSNVETLRHNTDKETPIAVYTALVIHAETRKRDLIDKFHKLGLCVAYDRVLQLSANLGNHICEEYEQEGVVCPPKLKKGLFTTGQVDNIDHDPSSRNASGSFHGTAITLFQHPTAGQPGIERPFLVGYKATSNRNVRELPRSYTGIEPKTLSNKDLFVPQVHGPLKPPSMSGMLTYGKAWLTNTQRLLNKEKLDENDSVSWSAYYASLQPYSERPVAITALLPVFNEKSHSVAMITHAMKLIKETTQYLNPEQCPVLTVDQPLYALSKQIQWSNADYGEDSLVVMMGGLHIEMAVLRMIGRWLDNSGWTSALEQAGITTAGRADAITKGSHVTRSRYAHQVSAVALYLLQKKAYDEENAANQNVMPEFERWVQDNTRKYPQFLYWDTVLKLELLLLEYVRSIREGNFNLYVEVLGQLAPWMFALDCNHYARWLPIHVRDMLNLHQTHPDVYSNFMDGNFVVKKSDHAFSMIALDHCHEQENAKIKGQGGAIGLTEDPSGLRRWLVAGPEVARVVSELEESLLKPKAMNLKHHDQIPSVQVAFAKNVCNLVVSLEDMENPFKETSNDLVRLDTNEIMPHHVINAVKSAHELGIAQYQVFVDNRLNKRTVALTDTVSRNNLPLFGTYEVTNNVSQSKVSALKSDCNLFARLYIACQTRDGNIEEFFRHENNAYPPSLSAQGKLRQGKKSDLLQCIGVSQNQLLPAVTMKVFDGAAVVNMLAPGKAKTFQEYSRGVFLPYIINQAKHVKRVDVVWDRYLDCSLKKATRVSRGKGIRRRVLPDTVIPSNWQTFLRCTDNKVELFQFLGRELASLEIEGVLFVSTSDVNVVSSRPSDMASAGIDPTDHEEADTRLMLHVAHGAAQGHKSVLIRTVDTDVVVLAVTYVNQLDIDLWLAFGVGKHFTYISANSLAGSLGPDKCKALPFFHAFSGSDTTSSFSGRGKKTAFDAWEVFPEVTPVFRKLSFTPEVITAEDEAVLERYTVIMYSRTCPLYQVNKARQTLFAQGTQSLENIPPTQAALTEHIKRAAYQGGYVWGQALDPVQNLPSPTHWGWTEVREGFVPKWTTLPEASKVCQELVHCGCKKACRGLCKCSRANLSCTSLCYCGGACHQAES